jgi:hypothetical protein
MFYFSVLLQLGTEFYMQIACRFFHLNFEMFKIIWVEILACKTIVEHNFFCVQIALWFDLYEFL